LDWLARQGQTAGFRLIPLEPDAGESGQQSMDVVTSLRMTGHRGQQRITIEAARFEGVVEVVDPDAMREAIVRGLGRGRAYGCGLLSVKPVPPH
jgi:CRISPR system Cascade subunit CasE